MNKLLSVSSIILNLILVLIVLFAVADVQVNTVLIYFGIMVVTAAFVVMIYVIRNLLKQNNEYESWFTSISTDVQEVLTEIDRLDNEGVFRAEDEVGYFFEQFKLIIQRLEGYGLINEEIENLQIQENTIWQELPKPSQEEKKVKSTSQRKPNKQ